IQAGNNDGCYTAGHLQGDLNSFMLVFDKERLLIDAGHSCYRNLIHGIESSTQTHNTCTFLLENESLGLQEDLAKIKLLEQKNVLPRRKIVNGKPESPIERGGKIVHYERLGNISLVASEVANAYGAPIQEFLRVWVQVGAHLTFVIDRIQASEPVRTVWNWLVNNRDERTIWERQSNLLSIYRHQVGMKLFNANQLTTSGVTYAYAHDAYHPEPNERGEGKAGSGLLFRHTDKEKQRKVLGINVIATDELALIDEYNFEVIDNQKIVKIQIPQEEIYLEIESHFPLNII
ncbi:MAG: heparinase II/III family protein, partial [Thermoflexibacter sp.]|nr:heparinase II/III family protein [Thermoflexibacter sp.]